MKSLRNSFVAFLLFVLCSWNADANFIARKPLRKTWWAKRVTDTLFVAGRLSDIQIKYASEDGFKSIVSVYNHTEPGSFGSKVLVPTIEAKDIAVRLSGLEFEILCGAEKHNEDDVQNACWRSKEAVEKFGNIYKSIPKPVLLYSNTGYSAAFIALAWLVHQTHLGNVDDPDYQTSAEHLYRRASGLGYDFSNQGDLKEVVEELGGGQKVKCPAKPDLTLPDWHKHYWWAKPVEKNWYIAGQIRSNQLDLIQKFNPDVMMNSRKGPTYFNPDTNKVTQTQEEVTLLNVNEKCSTYCSGGRQSEQQLLANRIDPNKPSEYISPNTPAEVNYMSRNLLEFGDDIGYNETLERMALKNLSFEYIHTPIGGHLGYHETMFRLYNGTWRDAHSKGNILIHCRTGYRAMVPTLLTLGLVMEKDMDWVIAKGKLAGYSFTEQTDASVWNLFKFAFKDSKPSNRSANPTCPDESGNGATNNPQQNGFIDELMVPFCLPFLCDMHLKCSNRIFGVKANGKNVVGKAC